MIFSAVKSPQGVRDYAPWCVFVDGREIINGIENEAEAQSIIQLLRTAKPKTLPPPKPPRFQPRKIEGWKLISTRRLCSEQKGAVILELALCLPVVLLLLLGGLDLSRMANAKSNAAGFGMDPTAVSASAAGNTATIAYVWQPVGPFFSAATMQSTAVAP